MLNHITIMGRLTKDPELRQTNSGTSVTNFTLACDRDRGEDTDFLDVVAFGRTAEFVSQYFSKGQMAVASGRLQIRTWTDKDDHKHYDAEIVAESVYFGEPKRERG